MEHYCECDQMDYRTFIIYCIKIVGGWGSAPYPAGACLLGSCRPPSGDVVSYEICEYTELLGQTMAVTHTYDRTQVTGNFVCNHQNYVFIFVLSEKIVHVMDWCQMLPA